VLIVRWCRELGIATDRKIVAALTAALREERERA
jgi:hypothetical protein